MPDDEFGPWIPHSQWFEVKILKAASALLKINKKYHKNKWTNYCWIRQIKNKFVVGFKLIQFILCLLFKSDYKKKIRNFIRGKSY